MTSDDLDRILATDEPLVPSSGFAAAVLERVRETAAAPPPLPFPWRPALGGSLAATLCAGLCTWLLATLPSPEALDTAIETTIAALTDPRLALATGAVAGALAGTYLLWRLSLRYAGAGR